MCRLATLISSTISWSSPRGSTKFVTGGDTLAERYQLGRIELSQVWVTRVINTQLTVIMKYAASHLVDKVELVFVRQLEMGEFDLGVTMGVLAILLCFCRL